MQKIAHNNNGRPQGLRVLLVDNNEDTREQHASLLRLWGYTPVLANGIGDALLADAAHQAKAQRCQIALVDMRLRDDTDRADWSGLELVSLLRPTIALILSGFGDRQTAVAALKHYGAEDFVAKEDGPQVLDDAIIQIAQAHAIGFNYNRIIWSHGLSSATLRDLVNKHDIPADEADELVSRLFPKAQQIRLHLITDDNPISERVSALRRRSRVFLTTIDNQPAIRVVKLARVEKIRREIANYDRYVRFGTRDIYRPEKIADVLLWDLGAVAYSYVGVSVPDVSNSLPTFTEFYRTTERSEQILQPLRHFFGPNSWGYWYTIDTHWLDKPLFAAYDEIWGGDLSKGLESWQHHDREWSLPTLQVQLPNPTRWVSEHTKDTALIRSRLAITHGDLHGDNLFVDNERSWAIDFERTGSGPILRDFVEIIQDIVTRIARFTADDLRVFFELAVAICTPRSRNEAMIPSQGIIAHPVAFKTFQVVQKLQIMAQQYTRYEDRREYLWGLLLNNLFVMNLLPEHDPRYLRTRILAALICHRLEYWQRSDWSVDEWLLALPKIVPPKRKISNSRLGTPIIEPYTNTEQQRLRAHRADLQQKLLRLEEQKATFIDPRSIPPDILEAEQLRKQELAQVESQLQTLDGQADAVGGTQ